ncbi:MAG: sortase [Candidatus Shapirobacteria bacterium]
MSLKSFFQPRLSAKTIRPKPGRKNTLFYNPTPLCSFIFGIGSSLFLAGIIGLFFLYTPLIKAYFNYKFGPSMNEETFAPPTDYEDFYLFIPKLKASSKVYINTDFVNKENYLEVLKKGVAHAAGSGFPDQNRTIYLFAHSTNAPFNVVRYNAVFFLLNELEKEDLVVLFFNGQHYRYKVFDKIIARSEDKEYLNYSEDREVLLLQTCYPPGTTWHRLLVFAEPI